MSKLYWIDLETTGLDPSCECILEIAVAEADFSNPFEIKHIYNKVLTSYAHMGPLESVIANSHPVVQKMHTDNGLWEDVKNSALTYLQVEEELLKLIPETTKDNLHIFAGSSVHFDAGFICAWMPTLYKRFSHKMYDVSAIKMFCESIGMPYKKGEPVHRAKEDVIESVRTGWECHDWCRLLSDSHPSLDVSSK